MIVRWAPLAFGVGTLALAASAPRAVACGCAPNGFCSNCVILPGTITVTQTPPVRLTALGQAKVAQAILIAMPPQTVAALPPTLGSGATPAQLGKVGSGYALDLYGDNLLKFPVDDATAAALGTAATGVVLTPEQARHIVDAAVPLGSAEARTAAIVNGAVVLSGP